MAVVRMPDGTQVRFPENMPPDQIRALIRQRFPEETADAPAAPPSLGDMESGHGIENAQGPFLEDPLRAGQIGIQAAGRGVADVIGAPVDLTNLALTGAAGVANLGLGAVDWMRGAEEPGFRFGRIEQPIGGSDSIANVVSRAAEAVGIDPIEREDMLPREGLAFEMGRFGTGAAAGSAGLASRAAAVGRGLPGQTPSAGDAILRPYRDDAARTFAGDAAMGTGAGVGAHAAEELAPDSVAAAFLGPFIGGTGGGVAASVARSPATAGQGIRGAMTARDVPLDPESGLPVSNRIADLGAEYMQRRAVDPGAEAETIGRRAQQFRDAGQPVPTTGLLADDPGITGIEQASRISDPTPFTRRDIQVQRDAGERLAETAPQVSEAERRAAQELAQREAGALRADAAARVRDAEGQVGDARARLTEAERTGAEVAAPVAAQRGRTGDASRQLDEVVDETLGVRTKEKNLRFDQAREATRGVERDATPLVQTAQSIRDQVNALGGEREVLPAEFVQKIERLAARSSVEETGLLDASGQPITRTIAEGGTVDTADLVDIGKHLRTAEDRARRAGAPDLADSVQTLKRTVRQELDDIIATGSPGSAEIAAARAYYQQEYAPFFATGFGRKFRDKVQRDLGVGESRVDLPPSATADFFLGGAPEAAEHVRRILDIAPNQAAGERAARNYFTAQLASTIGPDGQLNPATMRKWLDNHQANLRPFPEVEREFRGLLSDVMNNRHTQADLRSRVDGLARDLRSAERNVADTERRIGKSVLSTFLNNDPVSAARNIFRSGDPEQRMREAVDLVKQDERAMRAFKRSVSDYLVESLTNTNPAVAGGETLPVSFDRIQRLFQQHRRTLSEIYSPEEMNALQQVQRLLEPYGKLSVRATRGSPTAENLGLTREGTWRVFEGAMKARYGVLKGGGIMRVARIFLETLPGPEGDVRRLITRMSFEPELAQHLLTRPVREAGTPGWNRRLRDLIAGASAGREVGDAE